MGYRKVMGKIVLLGARPDRTIRKEFSLQGQGDLQVGGNQSERACGRRTGAMTGSPPGVTSAHFGLFLLEQSMEFSLGKRPELAEGQVCHGQPLVFHSFESAKYLPTWSRKRKYE